MMTIEKEKIVYNSLNEALLAGVCITHVGDDGEYVEYLKYDDEKYSIERWIYGSCVSIKTFNTIKDLLKRIRKKYSGDLDRGIIKKYYSIQQLKEELKAMINIPLQKDEYYSTTFTKILDRDYTYFIDLHKTMYDGNVSYSLEAIKAPYACIAQSLISRSAKSDEQYLKVCDMFIDRLVEMGLEKDWYRELKVEIKNIKGERGINNV